jgi:polyphosphate glucokinase
MDVLTIDIGGSHVKLLASTQTEPRRFDSGKELTPENLVARVRQLTVDWRYEVIALGFPGAVGPKGLMEEPANLGDGWVGFDFERAFGCPVRVVNDAVMQALGAYAGGRMLFLGLGTGLGSALVCERVLVPLELGDLPYCHPDARPPGETLAEQLGKKGREQHGAAVWLRTLHEVTRILRCAVRADYVVLGGGNAEEVDPLPERARRGSNHDAFVGGFRLWEEQVEPHAQPPSDVWRVVN